MNSTLKSEYRAYRTWVFDCDGVLLDSNAVKTQAFHDVARAYGLEAADRLMDFHVENGGVSRFVKFEHLFQGILNRAPEAGEMDRVLTAFAEAVKARLLDCPAAPRLDDVLRAVTEHGRAFVVSGGMQDELRDVFARRCLSGYFTAIFGSPDTKDDILAREREAGRMSDPAVFVGDARYDFEVARRFGLDFVFAADWSDFTGGAAYFNGREARVIGTLADLLDA